LGANPKQGQTLQDAEKLLVGEIDKIKKGDFPDWLLEAVINDLKKQQILAFESNDGRATELLTSFVFDIPWGVYVNKIDQLSKITKQQVMKFAADNYKEYAVVYKKTGEDKNILKVTKPPITPVGLNRDEKSVFLTSILSSKVKEIEPVFVDFKKDLDQTTFGNNIELISKRNAENELFNLLYVWDYGKNNNKNLSIALDYIGYLGTSTLTPAQVKQEFYKLSSSYTITTEPEKVIFHLSGLQKNFEQSVKVFEDFLADLKPNDPALSELKNDVLKKREDDKLNKNTILWQGMYNYGIYGNKNPFTNILSSSQVRQVKSNDLIAQVSQLMGMQHRLLYYGPVETQKVKSVLTAVHKVPAALKPVPEDGLLTEKEVGSTHVYVIDYDMKQAEIMMLSKSEKLNKSNFPKISMFSEYFGGGMASVVFQTLRESKALAYSTFASYQRPDDFRKSHYVVAYIGTQADKLPEAMAGMFELLNDLPESANLFEASKNSVLQKIRTERITKSDVLLYYERNRKMGIDYDYRKDIFTEVPSIKFEDIKSFHQKYLKGKSFNIMVLGDKKILDIKTLEKYGPVKYLTLTDVFGY
jgi:predicted Zn-dependent peptidase